MSKEKDTGYIEDIASKEGWGDTETLQAGEEDKPKSYPDEKDKVGNQSKEYYKD